MARLPHQGNYYIFCTAIQYNLFVKYFLLKIVLTGQNLHLLNLVENGHNDFLEMILELLHVLICT